MTSASSCIPSLRTKERSALTSAAPVGTVPAAQTVQRNNAGGGTLTGLSVAIAYGATGTNWLSA